MAFDVEGFKQAALQQGYSEEGVNAYLQSMASKDLDVNFELEKERARKTSLGRFLSSAAIPGTFAVGTGLVGALLGPVGAGVGAGVGYGAGKATQDMLLNLAGIRQRTPEQHGQYATDVGKESVKTGAVAGVTAGALKALGSLVNPTKTVAGMRAGNITKRGITLGEAEAQQALREAQSSLYGGAAKKEAKGLGNELMGKIFPTETVSGGPNTIAFNRPGQVPLTNLYNALPEFERQVGAYASGSPQGLAGEAISRALRGLPQDQQVKIYNALLQKLIQGRQLTNRIPSIAIGAGTTMAAYQALPAIKRLLSGE